MRREILSGLLVLSILYTGCAKTAEAETIYYLDDELLELTKENVKDLYFMEYSNEQDFDLSD